MPPKKQSVELVKIFDTTLRDGEQSPGNTMNLPEKLRVARQLESLGVDIIEAGFPIASQGDFEAVKKIASEIECVTKTIVFFVRSQTLSKNKFISSRVNASSAPKGSSIKRTSGSWASARTIDPRCFIPPDNSPGYEFSNPLNLICYFRL